MYACSGVRENKLLLSKSKEESEGREGGGEKKRKERNKHRNVPNRGRCKWGSFYRVFDLFSPPSTFNQKRSQVESLVAQQRLKKKKNNK